MSAVIWQYPAALIALAGLLVPLVIHLLDRGSTRQLDFAPLYLLQELPRASLRRLRLRERLLWLLRSLLVATAALLLASPALRPEPAAAQAWLLVQPGLAEQVDPSLERLSRQWGIEPGAIEVRWLDPELAPLSQPARKRRAGDLWGALLAADTRLPASARLAVIADPHADDLGPVRPRLSRAVEWLTSGTRNVRSPAGENALPLSVFVAAAPERSSLAPVLTAVVTAWQQGLDATVVMTDEPAAADWILYAPAADLPEKIVAAVTSGALLLTDTPAVDGMVANSRPNTERRRLGAGLWLRRAEDWTALAPAAGAGDSAFPLRLWHELRSARLDPLPPGIEIEASQAAPASGAEPRAGPAHSLATTLGALLLWLLALERWLSARFAAGRML